MAKDKQQIQVSNNTTALVPRAIVESKMSVSANQMDILAILLAEIGKDTDIDENLNYELSAADYAKLKGFDSPTVAYKILKDKICGNSENKQLSMRHIGFEMWMEDNHYEEYNWFSKVAYIDGVASFRLTQEIKTALVDFKKNDTYKVFAKLQYILPMKSQYSKRIYLMCREFVSSGTRFCDTDWKVFLEKLGVPSSYSYSKVKERILDKAKAEINKCSDITIDYEIEEKDTQGGKQPLSIKFKISKEIESIEEWN